VPVFLGVGAIDLGYEVADEGLLVERCEIGAQEVVASTKETVMIDLGKEIQARCKNDCVTRRSLSTDF